MQAIFWRNNYFLFNNIVASSIVNAQHVAQSLLVTSTTGNDQRLLDLVTSSFSIFIRIEKTTYSSANGRRLWCCLIELVSMLNQISSASYFTFKKLIAFFSKMLLLSLNFSLKCNFTLIQTFQTHLLLTSLLQLINKLFFLILPTLHFQLYQIVGSFYVVIWI